MTENKHTPGPWFNWVEYREAHGRSVVAYRDENGATASVLNCERQAANARLIAAAPALLEALGMVVYQYDKGHYGCPLSEAIWQARAALAAAKGDGER